MESEIWSAILSGCPSVTDSDVNRWRPLRLMRVELLHAARARTGSRPRARGFMGLARIVRGSSAPPLRAGPFKSTKYSSFRDSATRSGRRVRYGSRRGSRRTRLSTSGLSASVFSTSIVQSARSALSAPIAAATGAMTAPITPAVSGNSATVLPRCLTTTRRMLPSSTSCLSWARICSRRAFELLPERPFHDASRDQSANHSALIAYRARSLAASR